MNEKTTAILFPALLTATLLVLGLFANIVANLDTKVDKMAITQAADGRILRLLEEKILR